MVSSRSMNSYIRRPRSVTLVPIARPFLNLKLAIALRARVTTGRCPEMMPSSSTAESSSFPFCVALPIPTLTTMASRCGTCISFR